MARHSGVRRGYIYALLDPRTGETRYVGQTVNVKTRVDFHIYGARTDAKSHCHRWIAQLLAVSYKPLVVILEEGDWTARELNEAERRWILRYDNLTNMTPGGEGGGLPGVTYGSHDRKAVWTDEKRQRHSERLQGPRGPQRNPNPHRKRKPLQSCACGQLVSSHTSKSCGSTACRKAVRSAGARKMIETRRVQSSLSGV